MELQDVEHALSELRRLTTDDFILSFGDDAVKLAYAYGAVAAHFAALDEWVTTGGALPQSWQIVDAGHRQLDRDSEEYKTTEWTDNR
jgi:hypothetical protein